MKNVTLIIINDLETTMDVIKDHVGTTSICTLIWKDPFIIDWYSVPVFE